MAIPRQTPESVLFITIDSCRYDTFAAADVPNLKAIGPLHLAQAPGHFTYASHMAMFMGFTPGNASMRQPWVNPKFGKIFRMAQDRKRQQTDTDERFVLEGRNIIDGFRKQGYLALGTAAVGWFNPAKETSRALIQDFDHFYFAANTWSLDTQLDWIERKLTCGVDTPVFLFLNIGETHVPYYFRDAPWSPEDNPCVPFSAHNSAEKSAHRQRASLEYVDRRIGALLQAFAGATIFACADHGDCWGEDGLWEHGISHPKVLDVPLLFRVPPG